MARVLDAHFADSEVLNVGTDGYQSSDSLSRFGSLLGAVSPAAFKSGKLQAFNRGSLNGCVGLPFFLALFAVSQIICFSLLMLIGVGWTLDFDQCDNKYDHPNQRTHDALPGAKINGLYMFLFVGMAPAGITFRRASHLPRPFQTRQRPSSSAHCSIKVVAMYVILPGAGLKVQ